MSEAYETSVETVSLFRVKLLQLFIFGGRGRILTYESTGLQPEPLNTLVPDHI